MYKSVVTLSLLSVILVFCTYAKKGHEIKENSNCDILLSCIMDLELLKKFQKDDGFIKINFAQNDSYPTKTAYKLFNGKETKLVISDIDKKNYPIAYNIGDEIDLESFLKNIKDEYIKNGCSIEEPIDLSNKQ